MYSQENYLWGLVAYGLGILLVMPAMFKVTGWVMPWKPLRVVLRVFFTALLITPVRAYSDVEFLAPAWVVAVFETIRPTSEQGPALAYAALSISFAGLLMVTAGYYLARYFWQRRTGTGDPGSA